MCAEIFHAAKRIMEKAARITKVMCVKMQDVWKRFLE